MIKQMIQLDIDKWSYSETLQQSTQLYASLTCISRQVSCLVFITVD